MEAAVWKDFPYYRKFEKKFNGKAAGIVSALERHYSNDGRFDGFFEEWCQLEEGQHMSEDQILETMREKAAAYDKKAEDFFKRRIADLAKTRGIGEKGIASILGRVYMESEDKQRHLMSNYMKLIEGGADKSKIDGLVMERFSPKNPGNNSFWGKIKKYGKKPVVWASAVAVAAAVIGTCYFSKQEKYEQKVQDAQYESLCPSRFKKLSYVSKDKEVRLLMPEGSNREGLGRNYKVILRRKIQRSEDGSVRVRIRQNVKPQAGVDAIGILSENGWVCGKPGEYITVELTPGEFGNYLSGEGVNFQVAALKKLSDGMYQSQASFDNLFLKK